MKPYSKSTASASPRGSREQNWLTLPCHQLTQTDMHFLSTCLKYLRVQLIST